MLAATRHGCWCPAATRMVVSRLRVRVSYHHCGEFFEVVCVRKLKKKKKKKKKKNPRYKI
eukprot:NODE_10433_length_306_cov_161.673307.p3 GENE.NODE_10433_length_306_cov_161.673307~~NODE_10433_length_306_cov_161.673307.p3  ORF type:complete len:60 (+),score=36.50 NODE_10433_length_306_cov_161.673307:96-275(+)